MEIEVQIEINAVVATVCGRVDTLSAKVFEKELADALSREEKLLVLDLAGLEYTSGSGLRVLLMALKSFNKENGHMRFYGVNDHAREVFDLARFLPFFPMYGGNRPENSSAIYTPLIFSLTTLWSTEAISTKFLKTFQSPKRRRLRRKMQRMNRSNKLKKISDF